MLEQESTEKHIPSPEEKLALTTEVLEAIQNKPDIAVSGSLSSIISERVDEQGNCEITAADIASINDVDLMKTTFNSKLDMTDLHHKIEDAGFGLESHPTAHASVYNSEMQKLILAEAQVKVGEKVFQVKYTRPAFLLVSLIDQGVGGKTDSEKMRRKVAKIQELKSFSLDDFKKVAQYEINTRRAMNKDTFRRLQQNIADEKKDQLITERTSLSQDLKLYESLFDEVEFHNKVKTIEDLEGVSYEDIRKITDLEKFMSEFQ